MNDRLTPIETIMWRAGQDATLRMTVGNLMVLDHPPTHAALVERLEAAAEKAPRLRRCPDDPSRVRTRAAWVEVLDFGASHHLRTVAVPSPGDQRQVLDLVALLEPAPFDPDRSPWDVTLIEGLEGGRAALFLRAHHALTDGPGGISLLSALLDPEGADPLPVIALDPAPPSVGDAEADERRPPGTVSVTIDLTRAAGAARGAARGAATAALSVDPLDAMVRSVQRGLDAASSVSRQVVVAGGALSSLPPSRSMTNRFEVISVPDAKPIALALGGSRNDLLVAAAATGLGAYQDRLGLHTGELRLALPAGRHRDAGAGGNWFAPTRVTIPTRSDHPGPHFGVVAERLSRARQEPAVRLTGSIAAAVSRLPTRLLLPALHAQARSVDFIATSFAGLRGPRTICGARVEDSYPFGPRLGCLMNITGFGNGDRLDVGVTLDPAAISEPDVFLDCLVSAFGAFAPEGPPAAPARPGSART